MSADSPTMTSDARKAARERSRPILELWKPAEGQPIILLRWLITEWCNYSCHYCPQTHDRRAPKGDYTAHAFDNQPLERWLEAFERHFADNRLSLVITGGEPMLDRKAMPVLLERLTGMSTVECVRIDTNASFDPELYDALDRHKITLMCTFHPTETDEDKFFAKALQLRDLGFRIGMVNYVMTHDNSAAYEERRQRFADEGIMLHPNPLWNSQGYYSDGDRELLRSYLPDLDYRYRTFDESPKGKKCLFPAIAYQMNQWGRINVGCYAGIAGSFFDDGLPGLFARTAPCPAATCRCLDMYSFLEGEDRNRSADPLAEYGRVLRERG